jgi:hypothetical protein
MLFDAEFIQRHHSTCTHTDTNRHTSPPTHHAMAQNSTQRQALRHQRCCSSSATTHTQRHASSPIHFRTCGRPSGGGQQRGGERCMLGSLLRRVLLRGKLGDEPGASVPSLEKESRQNSMHANAQLELLAHVGNLGDRKGPQCGRCTGVVCQTDWRAVRQPCALGAEQETDRQTDRQRG